MRKIYIFDYIGDHCGMHYYNAAFKELLSKIPDIEIEILSNYSDGGKSPFLKNFYKPNKVFGVFVLAYDIIKFLFKRIREPRNRFIVLSYGNIIDVLFILSACIVSKNTIVDVHEAVAQDSEHKKWFVALYRFLYGRCVKNVIIHSERSRKFMEDFGYKGKIMYVPHFKYCLTKKYDESNIAPDLQNVISADRKNILFFGNMTYNKGVDILVNAYSHLPEEQRNKLNIIIAGKDLDGTIGRTEIPKDGNMHVILRHINDDELIMLYGNTDFIALPYRVTSQSGILEMAFYFKKPIIASRIPYFEFMLGQFPSFGVLTGNSVEDYAATLAGITDMDLNSFYTDNEYDIYSNRKEMDDFVVEFGKHINNRYDE